MDKVKANQKSDADMLAGTDHGEPAHEESSETSRGEETAKKSNELKYLLQVWRRSDGQMLYERKLSMMLKGWGLTGDKFFYQEDDAEDDVFEIYMLEVQEGGTVKIHKIILP